MDETTTEKPEEKKSEEKKDESHEGDDIDQIKRENAELKASKEMLAEQVKGMQEQWKDMLTNPDTLRQMRDTERNPAEEYDDGQMRLTVTDEGQVDATKLVKRQEKFVSDMGRRMDAIEGENQTLRVELAVERAQRKYTDFDQYRERMVKLARQHPQLTVDQYYILAKSSDLFKAEQELGQKKKASLLAGSNQASATSASSEVEKALAGKEGREITEALFDLHQEGKV